MATASQFTLQGGTILTSNDATITATSYGNNQATLVSVVLGTSATSIGNTAFQGCSLLTSISFSNTVLSLGTSAFSGCSQLNNVTLPSNLTTINGAVFYQCTNLQTIVIPNSVTSIGTYVFFGCTKLTSCTFPNTATIIPDSIFTGCSLLSSVVIPPNVTTIQSNAFSSCVSLPFIEIPPNVTTIQSNAFSTCRKLATIVFDNASSANNKLNTIASNVGFSTANSLGTPPYPQVYFYNAADSSALTIAAQNISWPTSTVINYNGGASCFSEGIKILCLNKKFEEEYIPIEKLRKGDLVKSYLHGYRKVELIGKGYSVSDMNKFTECMYKMVKTETNGLIEDLILTGGHGLLVNDLGEYTEKTKEIWNELQKIDDKYLLLAGISNDFEKLETVPSFYYYQFILENNGDNKERFGIWANGVLVETSTKEHFLSHAFILL